MNIALSNRTSWKILELLGYEPGRGLNRKEIQKRTKIGNRVMDISLYILRKYEILLADKKGKIIYYKLNLANEFALKIIELLKLERKFLNNIDYHFLLPLKEFLFHLLQIVKLKNIDCISLFGSVAKGTARVESDIDLAVISFEKVETKKQLKITELIENIKKRFGRKIQVHYFTKKEFSDLKKKKDLLAEEIERSEIKLI